LRAGKRVVLVDCGAAGISGDMLLGALLDLGVREGLLSELAQAVANAASWCRGLEVRAEDVIRGGFKAKRVLIKADEKRPATGEELLSALLKALKTLSLSEQAAELAKATLKTLLEAEAAVHGGEGAHLHELGSVDTLIDILGVAACLEELGLLGRADFLATPVAVGSGLVRFSHGLTPVPAPATLEILRSRSFPFRGGPVEGELATPTGVAILVNLARAAVDFYPQIRPLAVGYGAGSRDLPGVPNVLRVVVGESVSPELAPERVCVLETNVDDVDGELLGYVIEKLLSEGALDACVIPVVAKKNRPGHIVRALAREDDAARLAALLMKELGTLGVRALRCERWAAPRELRAIEVEVGGVRRPVRVKVAWGPDGQLLRAKPEFDDLRTLAEAAGVSLREVRKAAEEAIREELARRLGREGS